MKRCLIDIREAKNQIGITVAFMGQSIEAHDFFENKCKAVLL